MRCSRWLGSGKKGATILQRVFGFFYLLHNPYVFFFFFFGSADQQQVKGALGLLFIKEARDEEVGTGGGSPSFSSL